MNNTTTIGLVGRSNSTADNQTSVANDDTSVTWSSYLLVTFESLIFTTGVVGNLFVLSVMAWRRYRSQVVTQMFVASLYCYNLSMMFSSALPETMTTLSSDWKAGELACKLQYMLQSASMSCSVWTLLLLALDRSLSMNKVGGKSFVGVRVGAIIIACLLIYNVAYNIPLFQGAFVSKRPTTQKCGLDRTPALARYQFVSRFINFYGPLAALWAVHLGIAYRFKKSSQKIATAINGVNTIATGKNSSAHQMEATRKVTVVCAVIATLFTICFLPYQIHLNLISVGIQSRASTTYLKILSWINSCGNPVIYCLMWKPMNSAVKTLFGRITGGLVAKNEESTSTIADKISDKIRNKK